MRVILELIIMILKRAIFKKAIINVKMVLSGIASSILRLIDRIMNKIQLMSDKD